MINTDLSSASVIKLNERLKNKTSLVEDVARDVYAGQLALKKIMGCADGFQLSEDKMTGAHHYSNVVFNVLRGGIFPSGCQLSKTDMQRTFAGFNYKVSTAHAEFFNQLPETLSYQELTELIAGQKDPQLQRLAGEYLPITFGRRHGDPSQPWNQFRIDLQDPDGSPLLSYEGNWRDIFQNWEALCLSHPMFVPSMIAKFVNASTADGYNP